MGARRANSIGHQGLKPLFFEFLNVAAEAATHKDQVRNSLIRAGTKTSPQLWFCDAGILWVG